MINAYDKKKAFYATMAIIAISALFVAACSDSAEPMRNRVDNTEVNQLDSPGRPTIDSSNVLPPATWQNDSVGN